ncbi:MAG: aminotransferase class IV [Sandaracinus sp.]|nr:aminotransferase class IV [Sandaracinus sp.]
MSDAPKPVVSIDGALVEGVATVPITDRGFLYGDSIFETFRTYEGRAHALDRHLARLCRSADALQLTLPCDTATLADEVRALLRAADAAAGRERRVRLMVTRGDAPGLADDGARRVIVASPFGGHPEAFYTQGVHVVCVPGGRSHASTKAGSYLASILAARSAKAAGAYEPLLVDDEGFVTEGGTSNVFAVVDGTLWTPSAGMLPGVTRGLVLELARAAELPVREAPLPQAALASAAEAFLTSSTREVMPIARIDERALDVGPLTRLLAARYAETVPDRLDRG